MTAAPDVPIVAPDTERLISDVETLKAISDPLRLRMLEAMVARSDDAWSVKELARALDVPATRLYHHVELLVEVDLLRAAEQRVVSGIIETRYRIAALSLRLDPALVGAGGAGESAARDMLTTIFDETRRDLDLVMARPLPADDDPVRRPFVTRGLARLGPARARELRDRLQALLAEYEGPDDADPTNYRLLIALYADPAKEPSHG